MKLFHAFYNDFYNDFFHVNDVRCYFYMRKLTDMALNVESFEEYYMKGTDKHIIVFKGILGNKMD